MEKKDLAIYTLVGILTIESIVVAWTWWQERKNKKDSKSN